MSICISCQVSMIPIFLNISVNEKKKSFMSVLAIMNFEYLFSLLDLWILYSMHHYLFITMMASFSIFFCICRWSFYYRNNNSFMAKFITQLAHRFSLKNLGALSYFLGVKVISTSIGLFLCQQEYVFYLFERSQMSVAKDVCTPLQPNQFLSLSGSFYLFDATEYHSVIVAL